jgi:predicted kinase
LKKASEKNPMLKVPSTIEKVETRSDGTLKLVIGTQELDPVDEAEVMQLKRKLGYFVFAVTENITVKDIPTEQLEFKNEKSHAQRLRAVLYRLWETNQQGYKEFEGFYRGKMDKIIDSLKEKL